MSALKLITDRTEADRLYLEELNAKGWAAMTEEERFFWRSGTAEALELLDGVLETSDGLIVGAGDGVVRGAYNVEDMNRVETAVQSISAQAVALLGEISSYLMEKGVAPDAVFVLPYTAQDAQVEPQRVWLRSEMPDDDQCAAYLAQVQTIKDILALDAPSVPADMTDFRVGEANDIEKILLAVEAALLQLQTQTKDRIDRTAEGWLYSGEFYAGEV